MTTGAWLPGRLPTLPIYIRREKRTPLLPPTTPWPQHLHHYHNLVTHKHWEWEKNSFTSSHNPTTTTSSTKPQPRYPHTLGERRNAEMNNGILTRGSRLATTIATTVWDYWPPSLRLDSQAAKRKAFDRALDQANRHHALERRNFWGNFWFNLIFSWCLINDWGPQLKIKLD